MFTSPIKAVDLEFHFLAVAMETRGKELQEAGEAKQRTLQRGGSKADASRPLPMSRPSERRKTTSA